MLLSAVEKYQILTQDLFKMYLIFWRTGMFHLWFSPWLNRSWNWTSVKPRIINTIQVTYLECRDTIIWVLTAPYQSAHFQEARTGSGARSWNPAPPIEDVSILTNVKHTPPLYSILLRYRLVQNANFFWCELKHIVFLETCVSLLGYKSNTLKGNLIPLIQDYICFKWEGWSVLLQHNQRE